MLFFLNEASLQGQFQDETEFRSFLEALLSARARSPWLAAMRTTPNLADREVFHGRTMRQVVHSWRGQPLARAIFAWVGQNGPFIDEDRMPEDEDLFFCLEVEVTDGGLGEAARRIKALQEVASLSFPGGVPDFSLTPLTVVHGFEDEPIAEYPVENFWNVEDAIETLLDLAAPAKNWRQMIEAARARFPALLLPDTIFENPRLAAQPFDAAIRDRTYALLGILNEYMNGRDENGVEGAEAQEVLRTHFQGERALFSPESEGNQDTFEKDMTFENPDGDGAIFAHWHGKISHRFFRIHFEWPVPANQKQLKVLYIGPKLTKS